MSAAPSLDGAERKAWVGPESTRLSSSTEGEFSSSSAGSGLSQEEHLIFSGSSSSSADHSLPQDQPSLSSSSDYSSSSAARSGIEESIEPPEGSTTESVLSTLLERVDLTRGEVLGYMRLLMQEAKGGSHQAGWALLRAANVRRNVKFKGDEIKPIIARLGQQLLASMKDLTGKRGQEALGKAYSLLGRGFLQIDGAGQEEEEKAMGMYSFALKYDSSNAEANIFLTQREAPIKV